MPVSEKLRDEIKRRMEDEGLSYRKLAAKAGIEYSTLHRLLSGKSDNARITTLEAIATAFGCTVEILDAEM